MSQLNTGERDVVWDIDIPHIFNIKEDYYVHPVNPNKPILDYGAWTPKFRGEPCITCWLRDTSTSEGLGWRAHDKSLHPIEECPRRGSGMEIYRGGNALR